MSYVLGQYNQISSSDDSNYMSLITSGTPSRRASTTSGNDFVFYDECLIVNSLSLDAHYYLHAKIKSFQSASQTFDIYLVKYDDIGSNQKQFVKKITIPQGNKIWNDLEFIFTPLAEDFDCILFERQKVTEDYISGTQLYSQILYEELSLIKTDILQGRELIKMGIQSRPGLITCINGEEIRLGKNGTYEIKNGIIKVNFFSVISAASEVFPITIDTHTFNNMEDLLEYLGSLEDAPGYATTSQSLLGNSKQRTIDAFVLDYIYNDEEV
jgi:hypothetical protein